MAEGHEAWNVAGGHGPQAHGPSGLGAGEPGCGPHRRSAPCGRPHTSPGLGQDDPEVAALALPLPGFGVSEAGRDPAALPARLRVGQPWPGAEWLLSLHHLSGTQSCSAPAPGLPEQEGRSSRASGQRGGLGPREGWPVSGSEVSLCDWGHSAERGSLDACPMGLAGGVFLPVTLSPLCHAGPGVPAPSVSGASVPCLGGAQGTSACSPLPSGCPLLAAPCQGSAPRSLKSPSSWACAAARLAGRTRRAQWLVSLWS